MRDNKMSGSVTPINREILSFRFEEAGLSDKILWITPKDVELSHTAALVLLVVASVTAAVIMAIVAVYYFKANAASLIDVNPDLSFLAAPLSAFGGFFGLGAFASAVALHATNYFGKHYLQRPLNQSELEGLLAEERSALQELLAQVEAKSTQNTQQNDQLVILKETIKQLISNPSKV